MVEFSRTDGKFTNLKLYRDLMNIISSIPTVTTMTSLTDDITVLETDVAALKAKNIQATTINTNSSGQVTWTFPTAYSTIPTLSADIRASTGQPYTIRTVSLSTSAVTLEILNAAVVSILGISVLASFATVGAGIPVHIIAMKAT